jgi:hypothetical protein
MRITPDDTVAPVQIINQFIYPLLYLANGLVFLSSFIVIALGAPTVDVLCSSVRSVSLTLCSFVMRRRVADRRQ